MEARMNDRLLVEHVAKAIFDHEQNRPFPPKLVNMALYGRHPVTWEYINDPMFVDTCSNQYREMAQSILDAVNSYKQSETVPMHDREGNYVGEWNGKIESGPRYPTQQQDEPRTENATGARGTQHTEKPWQQEVQEGHDLWQKFMDEKRTQNPCKICNGSGVNKVGPFYDHCPVCSSKTTK